MTTKYEVLEFLEQQPSGSDDLSRSLPLSSLAAKAHLCRLEERRLIEPAWGSTYRLTALGKERLRWYRRQLEDR